MSFSFQVIAITETILLDEEEFSHAASIAMVNVQIMVGKDTEDNGAWHQTATK